MSVLKLHTAVSNIQNTSGHPFVDAGSRLFWSCGHIFECIERQLSEINL